ncbi:hypothetical protein ACFO5K_19535 [Nocardia halotolerans]|uniref:Uncharacterized protein n=1 Tax=Nocardia halotolerans TaxID=1755878 RepID=A0ABV8VL64_9NOCA
MGLSTWLRGRVAVVPFVVTAPGGTAARVAVEREIREHGWRQVDSPAAADLLVIAGAAEHEFGSSADRVFESMSMPRARARITAPEAAAAELDAAVSRLHAGTDTDADQHETAEHEHPPASEQHPAAHEHAHEPMQHTSGGAGHGGHEHDMGTMTPGGLAMADRADDRDGLKLDVLTVPLGPILAWWPAGLVIDTQWQGDVVGNAKATVLSSPSDTAPFWLAPWLRAAPADAGERGRWRAARALDSASTLLTVAGWPDAATTARRVRDEMLVGDLSRSGEARRRRWVRRVAGSRVLRWSLRGVGRIPAGPDVPSGVVGDAHDRLLRWTADSAPARSEDEIAKPNVFVADEIRRCQWIVAALPELLAGAELAEARLIVAGLDPDIEVLTLSERESAHG